MNNFTPFTPDVNRVNRPSDYELCMRNCGCYRGSGGYPGGSGFNTSVTVSGRVIGTSGTPAPNYPMDGSVNGNYTATRTNRYGQYAISGLRGSDISVAPQLLLGVNAYPSRYNYINLQSDAPNSDFTLRAVSPTPGIGSGVTVR